MFSLNDQLLYQLSRKYHQDLIREAEKERLIRYALSFLGLGAQCGYADWGQMISFARNWIPSLATYWYIVVFPGTMIVLFGLAWNLLGDALRDILDPRLRGLGWGW